MYFCEKFNKTKLDLVRRCNNLPLTKPDELEDQNWKDIFKRSLKEYNGDIKYTKAKGKDYGRYFCDGKYGYQKFPRDIRNYLASDFYIDIDIKNCHLVILEQLFKKYNIEIPETLLKYNNDKSLFINRYKLKDGKLFMIKFINNDNCYENQFISFHNDIYNKLVPLLIKDYDKIYKDIIKKGKKKNINGSFLSNVLQDIENNILMSMMETCNNNNITVGALCFDGLLIEKTNCNIIPLMEQNVLQQLNYIITIEEKPMITDWEPIIEDDEIILKEYEEYLKTAHDDQLINYNNSSDKIESNISNQLYRNLIQCTCPVNNILYQLNKEGLVFKCMLCLKQFPPLGAVLTIPHEYKKLNTFFIQQNNVTINITNIDDSNIEFTEEELNSMKVVDNEEQHKLLTQYLEIESHTNFLEIVRFYSLTYPNLYGIFEYIGKDKKHIWYQWDKKWCLREIPDLDSIYKQISLDYRGMSVKSNSELIKKSIRRLRKNCGDMVIRQYVLNAWMSIHINPKFEELIDKNPYLLGFENGVFDLETMEFREYNHTDYLNLSVKYNYNKDGLGYENDIMNFFKTIIPNGDNLHFLLKTIASCLVGINREERLGIFTGNTRNGKGALTELLKFTLGDYFGTMEGTFLQNARPDPSSPQTDLIQLRKKRILIINEIDESKPLNATFTKNLIGNDVFNCRGLYSDKNIEFKAQFKIILNCNKRPTVDAKREDLWSKIYLLIFPNTFVDKITGDNQILKDDQLKVKMQHWGVDMMNILIKYYGIYKKEGLEYTKDILKNIQNEKDENDKIKTFINENLEFSPDTNTRIKLNDITEKYLIENPMKMTSSIRKSLKNDIIDQLGNSNLSNCSNIKYINNWKFKSENFIYDSE